MSARSRYSELQSERQQFLDKAIECSRLTLPYLIKQEADNSTHKTLPTPWQSVGAKAVVNLAAKLMLALLPPQTTFFKLQVRDDKLGEELDPQVRSELDLSFSKMERMVGDKINASNDRVVVHQALKHLVVAGNALIFMGKDGLKNFPLNRFCVHRDGDGNVLEIVTKELISRDELGMDLPEKKVNDPSGGGGLNGKTGSDVDKDVEVYTHVKLKDGRWVWHQECMDKILPGSKSSAPKSASPWLPLRFNSVDGEDYGRGRVEEFLGDFKSLEALSQALVEGSSVAAKVVFLVSPSATTKPQTLAQAGNGAMIQGRAEDVQVVQVGKGADFATASQMAQTIEQRLSDAFLILQIRQSERTTAEEVRMTQMELEAQLGGLFSLLTTEFLKPYLARILMTMQRSGELPKLPKGLVTPTIVAGVNALGRGQDQQSLTQFMQLLAGTLGPEAIAKYVDPTEYIKRLAAAQGIDYLNLIKSPETMEQEMQAQQQQAMQQEMVKQAGQFANSPMADPTKNPNAPEQIAGALGAQVPPEADPSGAPPQG